MTADRALYTASEAARALGISLDTLRRWDRSGRIRTERDAANRRLVPASEVERLRGKADDELSARNRFRGVVRSVEVEGFLARVEIDVTEPARVVAIITREAVEELGLKAGRRCGGDREVDLGHGGAMSGAPSRRLFDVALVAATALALTFLLLPLVAIFLRVPLGELVAAARDRDVAVDALVVTLETNAIAQALILLVGTPTAYFIASRRFRGRALAITLDRAAARPPSGRRGASPCSPRSAGSGCSASTFDVLGVTVSTGTKAAVVLAVAYVASPFYIRGAIASFEALDQPLLDASRTLGAGPARTFFRIALPLAAKGLGAAAALSFARGIGEFGATIMFAGSLQGVTQTLSLAIYAQFDLDFDVALASARSSSSCAPRSSSP